MTGAVPKTLADVVAHLTERAEAFAAEGRKHLDHVEAASPFNLAVVGRNRALASEALAAASRHAVMAEIVQAAIDREALTRA